MSMLLNLFNRLVAGKGEGPAEGQRERTPVRRPEPAAKPQTSTPTAPRQKVVLAGTGIAGAQQQYKRFPNLPGSDAGELARVGRAVCARLDGFPGAQRIAGLNLDMYIVHDFLSADECTQLMALIDAGAKPSTLLTPGNNDGTRTSHTCRLSSGDPLVAEVERRICDRLGLPLSHSETVQGQRYAAGQQFKMHNDYFAGGQPYSATVASEGGQRTWTSMVFLNDPEAGGCTNFPRAGVKVRPAARALLVWNNNDRQGLSNPYTHHEGMVVEAGTKYILTKWFREREWHSSAASDALRV
jgi:prolyl 4-hydroxylase